MPINNNLPDITLPVKLKTGEKPRNNFKEQLSSISVQIMAAPSVQELLYYIPEFVTATWRDTHPTHIRLSDRNQALADLFDGKVLPTALETVNITFLITGMDIIDTTHLLRHRGFSFSAQCTADRDLRHDDIVVKPGIFGQREFIQRYMRIVEDAKQLYADMIDSGTVSILDARTILTRNLDTFYYVRGCLKDILAYINQRLDEQIQPTSDNVIAMKLAVRLARQYPMLAEKLRLKIGGPDEWYILTVPTGRGSNIYMPKTENDTFEYKESWFLYNKRREDFVGNWVYEKIKARCILDLHTIEENFKNGQYCI